MAVTKERKEKLKTSLERLQSAEVDKLTPQKRKIFLDGFCLGKWDDDIIYRTSYFIGRDLINEIEKFLNQHKDV